MASSRRRVYERGSEGIQVHALMMVSPVRPSAARAAHRELRS
ncbi:hypothetical protein IAE33_000885, partial [Pseudomonas sp. S60]|nr:hypothetical protein [Pseudomonas sp. S60]